MVDRLPMLNFFFNTSTPWNQLCPLAMNSHHLARASSFSQSSGSLSPLSRKAVATWEMISLERAEF